MTVVPENATICDCMASPDQLDDLPRNSFHGLKGLPDCPRCHGAGFYMPGAAHDDDGAAKWAIKDGDRILLALRDYVDPYYEIEGRECTITVEPRPPYCDRGRWIAKVHPRADTLLALSLDSQDGWPRYYFDLERAGQEILAWMVRREQVPKP